MAPSVFILFSVHLPTCARKKERGKKVHLPSRVKGRINKSSFCSEAALQGLQSWFASCSAGPEQLWHIFVISLAPKARINPRIPRQWQPLPQISRRDFVRFVGCDASLFPSFDSLPTVLGCSHQAAPNSRAGSGGRRKERGERG